jgi:hypothetical protein
MKRSEFHGASVLARRLKGREAGKIFKKQMKHKKNKVTGSVTGYCPAGSPVISNGARPQARTALIGAAVGTATLRAAGLPIGVTTIRPAAAATSVSVSALVLNDSLSKQEAGCRRQDAGRTENGERRTENGERRNGKRRTENGERRTENGETENGETEKI